MIITNHRSSRSRRGLSLDDFLQQQPSVDIAAVHSSQQPSTDARAGAGPDEDHVVRLGPEGEHEEDDRARPRRDGEEQLPRALVEPLEPAREEDPAQLRHCWPDRDDDQPVTARRSRSREGEVDPLDPRAFTWKENKRKEIFT